MIEIVIDESVFMESLRVLLQYIAGKRALTGDEYFRHTICEADYPLISRLMEEALAWLSGCTGALTVDKEDDTGFWKVKLPEVMAVEGNPEREASLRIMVRDALLHRVVALWLRITGGENAEQWAMTAAEIVESICIMARRRPLRLRRSDPF